MTSFERKAYDLAKQFNAQQPEPTALDREVYFKILNARNAAIVSTVAEELKRQFPDASEQKCEDEAGWALFKIRNTPIGKR